VHKRRGEFASAVAALERALIHADSDNAPSLCLELAKLYERRLRDPSRALEYARNAITAEPEVASARRIARLKRTASRLVLPFPADFE
jgi:hypothetical protein